MSDQQTKPTALVRTLACPSCGGEVRIRANGISITAICGACGSTLDVNNPDVKIISEAKQRTREPPIALGMRGHLVGAVWEVIGFQTRTDTAEGWNWDEYLLFNPYRGFRFLVHDEENWTLYCMLRQDVPDPEAGFEGRRYQQQSHGTARTTYVLGEFYWRARVGDEAVVTEYRDGDRILSREANGDEIIWSRGITFPEETVQIAFGLKTDVPASRAVDAKTHTSGVIRVGVYAAIALFLLQLLPFGPGHGTIVFSRSFHAVKADEGHTVVSDPFIIPGKGGNLRISGQSPVSNDWVELSTTLSGPNNTAYSATLPIEYYDGNDSDGAWSEGSRSANVTFRSVPGGEYRLLIEPYAGVFKNAVTRFGPPAVDYTVTVTRHVTTWAEFLLALVLLLAYPITRYFMDR